MKRKSILFLSVLCLLFTSCSTTSYNIFLTRVECPKDAKEQFGETKIVKFKENDINKYHYEDDFIKIIWYVSNKQFNFSLLNKTNHTMKINWDDISYIDVHGDVGRVMHAGVKYTERNNSQPPTSIPRNSRINDLLLPTNNVWYLSGQYGGWVENKLFPEKRYDEFIGSKMSIMMPIMIENIQNDYLFEFEVGPRNQKD